MADVQISDFVWVLDGATSEEIANATAAIDAMSTDIDDLVTARTNIWFRSAAAVTAASNSKFTAWGWSPAGRTSQINRELELIEQRYSILHEVGGHHGDRDKLNKAKRAALQAIMDPPGHGWNAGNYIDTPNECYADQFPRAYAPATITRSNGKQVNAGYYGRQIPSGSLATYISLTEGAGAPAATTLAAASLVGAINLKLTAIPGTLDVDDWIQVDTGSSIEVRQLTFVGTSGGAGTGVSFDDPLTIAHASLAAVVETVPSNPTGGNIDQVVTANTANGALRSHVFSELERGATGTAQMRYKDGSDWGPWTDEIAVNLNEIPGLPKQLTVTPGTLTPDFGASINTADPDARIAYYSAAVYQVVAGGVKVFKMLVEHVQVLGVPKRIIIPYSGNVGGPLAWGQPYVFEVSLWSTSSSIQSAYALLPFIPTVDVGPLVTYLGDPLDIGYKIDDLTPAFVVADRNASNIDEAQLRFWANVERTVLLYDTTLLAFSSASSKTITIPVDAVQWGQDVYVDAAVRLTGAGELGEFSTPAHIHFNAQPGAPAPVSVRNDAGQVVQRADGVWITSTDTPTLVFPYRDVDRDDLGYVDDPTRREIELVDLSEDDIGASPYVITSGITDEWTVPTSLLDPDTTYKARADYDDSADARSAWSEFMSVRYSQPPAVVVLTPTDGATITDPTPPFSWTYDSDADKPAAYYELILRIAGSPIYDSGKVASDATAAVPPPIPFTGVEVDAELIVWDSDGLYGRALLTVTTAFSTPDAYTGLTVTPNVDLDALVVAWDVSEDAGFYATNVYAKQEGGQYRLVATISDPSIATYFYFAAAHNRETTIRVTQTNGVFESDPAEAAATLGGDENTPDFIRGLSLTRPDRFMVLPNGKPSQGDTQTDLEVFGPPGRGEKVVLNWGTSGYEGDVTILTQDHDLLLELRGWKEQSVVSIYKTSYGAVRYVRLIKTPDTDQPAGWINGQIGLIEVLPSAAAF